jgi:hypothetical protein
MRPRILLVALADWFGPTRLPRALRRAGFEVGMLADPEGLLAQSRHIDYRFALSVQHVRLGVLRPVLRALAEFKPRLVVPCDEGAAHLLQNLSLAFDGVRGPGGQLRTYLPPRVRETLLRSLGEPRSFPARTSRVLARKLAAELGLAAPASVAVPYLQVAEAFARDHGWPVVLTCDGQTGGAHVRKCANEAELHAAYASLTHPQPGPNRLGHAFRYALWSVLTGFHLAGDLTRPLRQGPQLGIEVAVPGRAASCTVVAYEGRVLSAISAVAETVHPPGNGNTTVVRLVEDSHMVQAARALVGRLGFTGFAGLDFLRDEASGKLWFLRFTPRPTSLSHLGQLAGGDLCAALYASVTNSFPVPQRATRETTVALFPQDWMRDPSAADRGAEYLDLPVDDDRLFRTLQARLPRPA